MTENPKSKKTPETLPKGDKHWLPIRKEECELYEKVGFHIKYDESFAPPTPRSEPSEVHLPPGWDIVFHPYKSQPDMGMFYEITDQRGVVRGEMTTSPRGSNASVSLYCRFSLDVEEDKTRAPEENWRVGLRDKMGDITPIAKFESLLRDRPQSTYKQLNAGFLTGSFNEFRDARNFIKRPDIAAAFEECFPGHADPSAYWNDLGLSGQAERLKQVFTTLANQVCVDIAAKEGRLLHAGKNPNPPKVS